MREAVAIRQRLAALHAELGIDPRALAARRLPAFADARRLEPVGLGTDGRDKLLVPAAASAWRAMRDAAAAGGISLQLVSAFRSVEFQAALIRAKLARGQSIDAVLKVNAPPGYSEHHSGRAVDIGEAGCPALEDAFDQTAAFAWLVGHAAAFGFTMSYPRDNLQGFLYEPWHWCWHQRP
jgi:D-alanyl-D-alanine carboxypeptidase